MAMDSSPGRCRIRFIPENIEITVNRGTNLLDAAVTKGIPISASCGGFGVCGTCKVKIESGTVETTRTKMLSDEEYQQGIRQACQSVVLTDLEVTILNESRLEKAIQTREKKEFAGISATGWRFDPPLKKYYLQLPQPTLADNISDMSRVMRGLRQSYNLLDLSIDFEVIRTLPEIVREDNWAITVTTFQEPAKPNSLISPVPRITRIESRDTRDKHYSLAIDIGTTTICSQLLDLSRGTVIAESVVFNKQMHYGADVIARINFIQKPGIPGLKKLQDAVTESINQTIDEILKQSHIHRRDIGHINIAGNTTMTQILLGLNPKYIRLSPYVPAAKFLPPVKANTLGIRVDEHVYVFTLPSISSYIGGDIVSGIVASGIHQRSKLTFFMDIGTNGEIVIGNSDWMVTASCSAGPAFEGGGIKFGMVAMNGAIQDFSLDPVTLEPEIHTIGNSSPKGICGSGLINTIAGLLEAGVIEQNGKFNSNLVSPRVRLGSDGYEYVLAWAHETQIGQDIVITEADIDNLIRSKAAMYAGCHTLSRYVNISCSDFEQVILAGNFGSSLNVEKAITIGLLPDIPREKFAFIGNSSLSGARLVSFSTDLMNQSIKVAQMMTNIELSENTEFNDNYMAALFLPHTDQKAFPSIVERLIRNKAMRQVEERLP
jgi:uncharacterized 2Fe-2S/4Fe-4S cluster protein (DUF4445 family)